MSTKRFIPINRRVTLIIVFSLLLGIGGITTYLALSLSSTIESSSIDGLTLEADLLSTAIENFMLPGQASLAISYFRDFNTDPTRMKGYSIGLFRRTGVSAFSDGATASFVNSNIRQPGKFIPNMEPLPFPQDVMQEHFTATNGDNGIARAVTFQAEENGRTFLRIYTPLINDVRCQKCHGMDHTVRGIIDIRKDITGNILKQRNALMISGALFLGIVLILASLLTSFLRAFVLRPVHEVGRVCSAVTQGNFDDRVHVKSRDEIGQLGNTVNTMVEGLYERYELSRYVSASTIKSIHSEKEGKRVNLTMFFSDIRSFTKYSEENAPETVVSNLNNILNMQTDIIHSLHGDIDKYVGDEIVAMFTEGEAAYNACKAALRIQKTLFMNEPAVMDNACTDYGDLKVGIGIHTGDVILGAIGSSKRADFTVIGDTVNTASRLCSAAKEHQILISETTYNLVKDLIHVDGPFRLTVKGKKNEIIVYFLKEMLDEDED